MRAEIVIELIEKSLCITSILVRWALKECFRTNNKNNNVFQFS